MEEDNKVEKLTQAERRALAEQKILDAAVNIVARRGSARMTLAEVGELAGYSRGLPAQRFGSKAGLLMKVADHIGKRFHARRASMPARQAGLDSIRGIIESYFDRDDPQWIDTRALLVMMTEGLLEENGSNRYISYYVAETLEEMENHVAVGVANGEIRSDINPRAAASLIVGALRGVLHQRLVLGDLHLKPVRDLLLQTVGDMLTVKSK